jgi:uncharacterized protein with PIN domain
MVIDTSAIIAILFGEPESDNLIWVISARDMHQKERIIYEQDSKKSS